MLGADAPFVLDHHKADAAGEGGVEFCVVEPAVHIEVGLVVECPFGTGAGTDGDGYEVNGQGQRDGQEGDDTAHLGATGKFIPEDEAGQNHQHHTPLQQRISAINVKEHNFLILKLFFLVYPTPLIGYAIGLL